MVKTKRFTVPLQTFYDMLDWCIANIGGNTQWEWQVYTGPNPKIYPADHTIVEFNFADDTLKFQFLLVFSHV